jgi:hypothetical protein
LLDPYDGRVQPEILEREVAIAPAHRAKRRISVKHGRSSNYPD